MLLLPNNRSVAKIDKWGKETGKKPSRVVRLLQVWGAWFLNSFPRKALDSFEAVLRKPIFLLILSVVEGLWAAESCVSPGEGRSSRSLFSL